VKLIYYFPGRCLPRNPAFISGAVHARLARAAEAAGFAAVALDEHPIPSESWRQPPEGDDCLDPVVGLTMIAGAMERIRILTYLAVVPFRNPFFLAKEAATPDVMSDGRFLLGLGLGYMQAKFKALGVDFAARRELFDEALEVLRLAWGGEPMSYVGSQFHADDVTAQPRPVQQPHPPIWIGGNGRATLQRAAASAQGWMAHPVKRELVKERGVPPLESVDDLCRYVRRLRNYTEEFGRSDLIDVVHSLRDLPRERAAHVEALREFEEAGVTSAVWSRSGAIPQEAEELIDEYGKRVIAQFADGRTEAEGRY
jgi:probable F420-dependent oxidoreductase